MAFDTLLQATWAEWDQDINNKIRADRELFTATMTAQEKISPDWEMISSPGDLPYIVHRGFINTDAANEWITGMNTICQTHNVVPPAFEIL